MTINVILANADRIAPAQRKVVMILAEQNPSFVSFCKAVRSHIGEKNYQKLIANQS